jgi:hypothetical protein
MPLIWLGPQDVWLCQPSPTVDRTGTVWREHGYAPKVSSLHRFYWSKQLAIFVDYLKQKKKKQVTWCSIEGLCICQVIK